MGVHGASIRTPNHLPFHPTLHNETSQLDLSAFCNGIVREAEKLIVKDVRDNSLFSAGALAMSKSVEDKTGTKSLYDACGADNQDERWSARSSEHKEEDIGWTEFEEGVLKKRLENEFDYKPDVYDCQLICEWPTASEEIVQPAPQPPLKPAPQPPPKPASEPAPEPAPKPSSGTDPAQDTQEESHQPETSPEDQDCLIETAPEDSPVPRQAAALPPDFTLQSEYPFLDINPQMQAPRETNTHNGLVYETAHKGHHKGRAAHRFKNRVFSLLVLTKARFITNINNLNPARSFLVVQIPVNITSVPTAFYSNGQHRNLIVAEDVQKSDVTCGDQYLSVEHCYQTSRTPLTTHWLRAVALKPVDGAGTIWQDVYYDRDALSFIQHDMSFFTHWVRDGKKGGKRKFHRPPTLIADSEVSKVTEHYKQWTHG
ncbi:hypothetical protein FKW77_003116 [Venturia effusa]|uniref:Uncharacterized protein n=1 Tax=Venturia effusa TaxID=50376 RepID=A0A517LAM7_9PEZI|nr:hypothetical protein FKW77_003116 [Venturia effusa]